MMPPKVRLYPSTWFLRSSPDMKIIKTLPLPHEKSRAIRMVRSPIVMPPASSLFSNVL